MTSAVESRQFSELGCVLIAAGNSSRLGQPKQLVSLNGETLLNRNINFAQKLCETCVCVLGYEAEKIGQTIHNETVQIINNPSWSSGMGTSIACGINNLPRRCEAVLILLCDQWAINFADLQHLVAEWKQQPHKIAASHYFQSNSQQSVFGAPAIFPEAFFAMLTQLRKTGARKILNENQQHLIAVKLDHAAFDLDTREDLRYFHSQINKQQAQRVDFHAAS